MDQIADIIHATIFGGSNAPPDAEKTAPLRTPLSGLAETIAKEKANRSAEKDTVSRGVAAPIEYIDEWDTSKSPPSASYAPNALSAIMDSKLASFYEDALSRMREYTLHYTLHKMHLPKFSQCEVIFNAKRGTTSISSSGTIFGIIGVAVLGDPPQRSASQKTPGAERDSPAEAGHEECDARECAAELRGDQPEGPQPAAAAAAAAHLHIDVLRDVAMARDAGCAAGQARAQENEKYRDDSCTSRIAMQRDILRDGQQYWPHRARRVHPQRHQTQHCVGGLFQQRRGRVPHL